MQYVMLIYQGDALDRQAALPQEEQQQVYADYQGINRMPAVTSVPPMGRPENATTVRVEGGRTLITDGPFVGMKEAVGSVFILEADDLDAAIEVSIDLVGAGSSGSPVQEGDDGFRRETARLRRLLDHGSIIYAPRSWRTQ